MKGQLRLEKVKQLKHFIHGLEQAEYPNKVANWVKLAMIMSSFGHGNFHRWELGAAMRNQRKNETDIEYGVHIANYADGSLNHLRTKVEPTNSNDKFSIRLPSGGYVIIDAVAWPIIRPKNHLIINNRLKKPRYH